MSGIVCQFFYDLHFIGLSKSYKNNVKHTYTQSYKQKQQTNKQNLIKQIIKNNKYINKWN